MRGHECGSRVEQLGLAVGELMKCFAGNSPACIGVAGEGSGTEARSVQQHGSLRVERRRKRVTFYRMLPATAGAPAVRRGSGVDARRSR